MERDGLPLSVGRARRTVPPVLRRLLEARDETTCCFPGCERRRHLQAHHRRHWANGGETSLDNLVLLCFHHHRLVHEGGYTIEDDPAGGLRFRNRYGLVCETRPPRPPPGNTDQLLAANARLGLEIGPRTNRNGSGDPLELEFVIPAIANIVGWPADTCRCRRSDIGTRADGDIRPAPGSRAASRARVQRAPWPRPEKADAHGGSRQRQLPATGVEDATAGNASGGAGHRGSPQGSASRRSRVEDAAAESALFPPMVASSTVILPPTTLSMPPPTLGPCCR